MSRFGTAVLSIVIASAILVFPRAADAQPAQTTPRIGVLHGYRSPVVESFIEGLRGLGWVENKNVLIERRLADGALERLPALAAELVRLNVRVIFSPATAGTRAAQQATSAIPIVFAGVGDPLGAGFIKTLARPGGNITGLTALNVELSGKRLELLREAVPHLKKVGVLVDPKDPARGGIVKEIETAGARMAVATRAIDVKDAAALPEVFAALAHDAVQGLVVGGAMFQHRERIAELARTHRIVTMSDSRGYVEAGMLMSYGTDYGDLSRRAAVYVDKILKGARPADLPVEQPTKFDLAINGKASLLLRADHVIE